MVIYELFCFIYIKFVLLILLLIKKPPLIYECV